MTRADTSNDIFFHYDAARPPVPFYINVNNCVSYLVDRVGALSRARTPPLFTSQELRSENDFLLTLPDTAAAAADNTNAGHEKVFIFVP